FERVDLSTGIWPKTSWSFERLSYPFERLVVYIYISFFILSPHFSSLSLTDLTLTSSILSSPLRNFFFSQAIWVGLLFLSVRGGVAVPRRERGLHSPTR
ncbi:hypothetical protein GIB67_027246, partial [Kingdonia uniflora]